MKIVYNEYKGYGEYHDEEDNLQLKSVEELDHDRLMVLFNQILARLSIQSKSIKDSAIKTIKYNFPTLVLATDVKALNGLKLINDMMTVGHETISINDTIDEWKFDRMKNADYGMVAVKLPPNIKKQMDKFREVGIISKKIRDAKKAERQIAKAKKLLAAAKENV